MKRKISHIAGAVTLGTVMAIATPVASIAAFYYGSIMQQNDKIQNLSDDVTGKIEALTAAENAANTQIQSRLTANEEDNKNNGILIKQILTQLIKQR